MKKLTLLFAMLAAMPAIASAQLSSVSCSSYTFFVGVTPSSCSGFWTGNELTTGTNGTPTGNEASGLAAVGLVGPYKVIQKIDLADPSQFVDFTGNFSGGVVIGIHWGGGVFGVNAQNIPTLAQGAGGGTVFFRFSNVSSTDKLELVSGWRKATSGASLYLNEGKCNDGRCQPNISSVPEPSTYALMGAGLLGIFAVARRRRNAQV